MAGKNVLEINDLNYDAEVLQSPAPFLLDFTAAWCAPCRALEPVIERIADENVGKFRVGKVDIDGSPGVVKKLGIRGAPTVVVFKGGRESARQLGVAKRERLLAWLGD